MPLSLTDLPQELLDLIPDHLARIEDLLFLSSTCRKFYAACSKTKPQTILRLAAAQSTTFFRPHPHFLIAATARQLPQQMFNGSLSDGTLRSALQGGINGLFDLCINRCGITLSEIRELLEMRLSLFNPLTDWIDKLAGTQWYNTPNFWDGGVSDAETIDCEPERALFQVVIYGELFGSSVENYIRSGGSSRDVLSRSVRFDFVKYCIPDWNCARGYQGLEVLNTGPYKDSEIKNCAGDQIALRHLLNCRRWNEGWSAVRALAGEDFGRAADEADEISVQHTSPWRQQIWEAATLTQGLRGFAMLPCAKVRPEATKTWRENLQDLHMCVSGLTDDAKPVSCLVPLRRPFNVLDFPLLADEVLICMRSYWPGTFSVTGRPQ